MKTKKIIDLVMEVFLWILSFLILIPIAMIVLNSVKSTPEAAIMSLKLPTSIHWENYKVVLSDDKLIRSFFNSLFISTCTVTITVFVSSMAAFVLARNKSRSNRVLYIIFLLGLVAPINYIATVKVMQFFHIINTYGGAILLYTAMFIPFSIFLFQGFISSVPRTLDEAALIDGCSGVRLFFYIIFPLLKPVTMTVVVLNFLNCWNDFIIPLYFLNSSDKWGMVMRMYNYFSTYVSSWNLVSVSMILNMLPIVVLYIFAQKYLISGMTAGAVKG